MGNDDRGRDPESGQFTPVIEDEEIIEAVREHEPAATSEVGDAVGLQRQNADYRLRQLEEEGRVSSKKVGNSLAWSLAEQERQ